MKHNFTHLNFTLSSNFSEKNFTLSSNSFLGNRVLTLNALHSFCVTGTCAVRNEMSVSGEIDKC